MVTDNTHLVSPETDLDLSKVIKELRGELGNRIQATEFLTKAETILARATKRQRITFQKELASLQKQVDSMNRTRN